MPAEETSIHCPGKVKDVSNLDHDTLQLLCNAAGLPPESPSLRTMVSPIKVQVQRGGPFSSHHTYTLQHEDVVRISNTADNP